MPMRTITITTTTTTTTTTSSGRPRAGAALSHEALTQAGATALFLLIFA